MPTTPHPADYSASNNDMTSTERKEMTINMSSADSHPEAVHGDDEPINPPHYDDPRCPCGALADRNNLCRKCRARALWERRQANRERRTVLRGSPYRRTGRDSSRPHGRRPGR
ncbi:MAG: hypothetical protein JO345_41805 [Streptosporangiaceae bacterium]|nr:hypothetical protein [Streptosporangiaceae bacterium]